MYYIFFSTNDVYIAEDILGNKGLSYEIVPTPVKDSVYCGVSIYSDEEPRVLKKLLASLSYELVEE